MQVNLETFLTSQFLTQVFLRNNWRANIKHLKPWLFFFLFGNERQIRTKDKQKGVQLNAFETSTDSFTEKMIVSEEVECQK